MFHFSCLGQFKLKTIQFLCWLSNVSVMNMQKLHVHKPFAAWETGLLCWELPCCDPPRLAGRGTLHMCSLHRLSSLDVKMWGES